MLFYPSHDIALAHGVRHFNPPRAALSLQQDLADLWRIWNAPYLRGEAPYPLPWGWDWDTRRHLQLAYHAPADALPTDADLEAIRTLSSRRTTIDLGRRLGIDEALLPRALTTPDEVRAYVAQHDADQRPFVLKTPWSSSGRGLTLWDTPRDALLRHADATLQHMGCLMAEEWIEGKEQDFAMLFYAADGRVRYCGLSLFDNNSDDGHGITYRRGYLDSNAHIAQRLGLSQTQIDDLAGRCVAALCDLLAPLLDRPWPLGYLGIDMLTYRTAGSEERLVWPCVELNLRCTMGVVCRLYYDQQETPQSGTFCISPMSDDGHFEARFDMSGIGTA